MLSAWNTIFDILIQNLWFQIRMWEGSVPRTEQASLPVRSSWDPSSSFSVKVTLRNYLLKKQLTKMKLKKPKGQKILRIDLKILASQKFIFLQIIEKTIYLLSSQAFNYMDKKVQQPWAWSSTYTITAKRI